jgi:hypothetical protein
LKVTRAAVSGLPGGSRIRLAWTKISVTPACRDEPGELLHLSGLEVGQGWANRPRVVADDPGAGLDDAHGIAGGFVANFEVWQEEAVEQAILRGKVVSFATAR